MKTVAKVLRTVRQLPHINYYTPRTLYFLAVRFSLKDLEKDFDKTEDDIKAVQSVGQIIGEVMKQLDDERCTYIEESSECHSNRFFSQSSSKHLRALDTSSHAGQPFQQQSSKTGRASLSI